MPRNEEGSPRARRAGAAAPAGLGPAAPRQERSQATVRSEDPDSPFHLNPGGEELGSSPPRLGREQSNLRSGLSSQPGGKRPPQSCELSRNPACAVGRCKAKSTLLLLGRGNAMLKTKLTRGNLRRVSPWLRDGSQNPLPQGHTRRTRVKRII